MRIFAFGCSLSQYFFPTWADILIHQYKNKGYQGENWAKSGAGNQYINTRLWEANTVHKFNKEDIILLQWTSMFREDRYHMNKGWWTPGNFNLNNETKSFVLNNYFYDNQNVWADPIHAVMRDCALISSTHRALASIGCKVITTGFRDWEDGWTELSTEFTKQKFLTIEDVRAVLEIYKHEIELTTPPILTALKFNTDDKFFKSRPTSIPSKQEDHKHMIAPEVHPLTHEAADFVSNHIEKLDQQTIEFVEQWREELSKDTILLYELNWFNKNINGWSDDGWRP